MVMMVVVVMMMMTMTPVMVTAMSLFHSPECPWFGSASPAGDSPPFGHGQVCGGGSVPWTAAGDHTLRLPLQQLLLQPGRRAPHSRRSRPRPIEVRHHAFWARAYLHVRHEALATVLCVPTAHSLLCDTAQSEEQVTVLAV